MPLIRRRSSSKSSIRPRPPEGFATPTTFGFTLQAPGGHAGAEEVRAHFDAEDVAADLVLLRLLEEALEIVVRPRVGVGVSVGANLGTM